MRGESANVGKVVRLHGELYSRLAAGAQALGLRPGGFASYILEQQAAKLKAGEAYSLHPLAGIYLPSHHPRPAVAQRAVKIKITAAPAVFLRIKQQAADDLAAAGRPAPAGFAEFEQTPPEERPALAAYPACRDFSRAQKAREKEIVASMLLFYLEESERAGEG